MFKKEFLILFTVLLLVYCPVYSQERLVPTTDTINRIYSYFDFKNGDFKRSMDPSKSTYIGLKGSGSAHLADWFVRGKFEYRKQQREKVFFSGVANAYEALPYIWGDSSAGDWRDDVIEAGAGLSSPWFGRHQFATDLLYNTSTGVRTSDPKPFYRIREIGVALQYNFRTGIRGIELFIRPSVRQAFEENEIGFMTASNSFVIRSKGYGSQTGNSIVSMDRRRTSLYWGTELGLTGQNWNISIGGTIRRDSVIEAIASPIPEGNYRERKFHLAGAYRFSKFEPQFRFSYMKGRGETFLTRQINEEYSYYPVENAFRNLFDAEAVMYYYNDTKLFPKIALSYLLHSDKWEDILQTSLYKFQTGRIGLETWLSPYRRTSLLLAIGYKDKLNGSHQNGLPSRLSIPIFEHDFSFYAARTFDWNVELKIPFFPKKSDNSYWLALKQNGIAGTGVARLGYTMALGMDL